jgi:hypothetical protein
MTMTLLVRFLRLRLLAVAASFAVLSPLAAETIDLGSQGSLEIALPKGWHLETQASESGGLVDVKITPAVAGSAQMLLSLGMSPPRSLKEAALKEEFTKMAAPYVEGSVEKQVNPVRIEMGKAVGFYGVFTDASMAGKPPEPDNFKVVGFAVVRLTSQLVAIGSLFCNDAKGGELADMVQSFASLSLAPRGSRPQAGSGLVVADTGAGYDVTVDESKLVLKIPPGFARAEGSGSNNPNYFQFLATAETSEISGWFEPAAHFTSARDVWEGDVASWKRSGVPDPRDATFIHHKDWDCVRYENAIPGASNTHLRAHYIQDCTWIDVHISVTTQKPVSEARARALEILDALEVVGK